MPRTNDQPIREVLQEMLDKYHLREKVNERRLKENWSRIFGKALAKYTRKISVSDKKLFVTLESAPLRNELMYNRDKMISRINEEIEPSFITQIVLL